MSGSNKNEMKVREETTLSQGMVSFLRDIEDEDIKKASLLHQAWEKVADERILEHTDSVRFSNKITKEKEDKKIEVLVFLDSSIWAAECNMERDSYRVLLEMELGMKIEDVHFYVTRDQRFKTTFAKKKFEKESENPSYIDESERIPLSSFEDRKVDRKVRLIEDEQLRQSVSKAMKSNLEWKKGKDSVKSR